MKLAISSSLEIMLYSSVELMKVVEFVMFSIELRSFSISVEFVRLINALVSFAMSMSSMPKVVKFEFVLKH